MSALRPLSLLGFVLATAGFCNGQYHEPPVLSVERRWQVLDNEPVGSIVTVAKAYSGGSTSPLVFGLEQDTDFNGGYTTARKPLPFTINNSTGVIATNESLVDRGGEDIYLFVTVYNGYMSQKTGVWARIENSSAVPTGVRPGLEGRPQRVPLQFGQGLFHSLGRQPQPPPPQPPPPQQPPPLPPLTKLQPANNPPPTAATTTTTTTTSTSTAPPPSSTTPSASPPASSEVTVTQAPAAPSPARIPNMVDIALTIVPIVIICIMFALAGIAAFLFRRRICRSKKTSNEEDMKKSSNGLREDPIVMQQWRVPRGVSNRYIAWDTDLGNVPPQEAPPAPEKAVDRWEFPRHRLKVFNILGEGCFGQVWKCEAQDIEGNEGPTIVAVKTLKENAGERERSDLLQELQVMKMLDPHPNVVRLLGCCTEKEPLFVIMEYVSHGKLQSFLRNSRAQRCYDNMHGKSNSLTSRHLTAFCYQVARGMQFLSNNGIIHRDLAARNILVGENYTCKVADFGFARDVITSHIYERKSEGRLPIRWMAPESLYDNIFSVKSDIWSFGVLIWEIVTLGSTPYPGLSAADVMKRVKDGYRLDKPEHCKRELYNIMYYCWEQDPKDRPHFAEVVDLLEQLLLTETDYIELQHFPDHSYYNIVSLSGEKL